MYQKESKDYYEIAKEIFEDYLNSENLNLYNKKLKSALKVFKNNDEEPAERAENIIRKYTGEDNSYYRDFNSWMRNPYNYNIEKISYFISELMLSLNEYGKEKGLRGEHKLYRGMTLTFSDLLLYKMNENSIILFLSSFLSLSYFICFKTDSK